MNKKEKRFLIFFCLCALGGMFVGGVSGWIENSDCNFTLLPIRCSLSASLKNKVINAMAVGLCAGVGAATAIAVGQKLVD
ncbi:hypothetical protein SD80_004830 [Scytonema tolypothrichoides VB-61278]|nr:hypothetical protein SD80_004830 [Scytonema tolypothrichoides VB-61278]